MVKRSIFSVAAVALVAVGIGFSSASGCSSKDSEPAPSPSTSYTSRAPAARPTATPTGTTKWFAINSLRLGLTNKVTGKADTLAWKDYGFDLDQRNTTSDDSKANRNTCKRTTGAPGSALADGNGGIDNNFGQQVIPAIQTAKKDIEDEINATLTKGSFTLLLKIDNVTDGDNASAPGVMYVASEFGAGKLTPSFTAKDVWQVNKESLEDGVSITKPKLKFPKGYISNGYWVSGDFGTERIDLNLSLAGAKINLPIDAGIIAVKLTDGSDGTIAGAMVSKALSDGLGPVFKRFGICPGTSTYETIALTLTQAGDLVTLPATSGGARPANLQDTTRECDSISIAIGFTMKPTGDHSCAAVYTSVPDGKDDVCTPSTSDAGTDGGALEAGGTDAAVSTDAPVVAPETGCSSMK